MFIQDVALRLKAASAGAFARPAPLFRFAAAALVGPFVLLIIGGREANNLPWYVWAIVPLLLQVVISVGFLRFTPRIQRGVGHLHQPGPPLITRIA